MQREAEEHRHHEPREGREEVEAEAGGVVEQEAGHRVGGELHHDVDDLRRNGVDRLEHADEGSGDLGGEEGDGDTDHEREEHELEHVRELAAHGLHRVGGHDGLHDLHQGRVSRTLLFLRQGLHLAGGSVAITLLEPGRGLGLDVLPRADGVGQGEADDHGDGRDHEAIAERAQADAAQPPYIPDPGHADDQ